MDLEFSSDKHGWLSASEAKAVDRELGLIEKSHGEVTPNLIVQFAKRPDSALHAYFEWDDHKAAEKDRLHTAGRIVSWLQAYHVVKGKRWYGRVWSSVLVKRAGSARKRMFVRTIQAAADPEIASWRKGFLLERADQAAASLREFDDLVGLVNAVQPPIKKALKDHHRRASRGLVSTRA